MMPADLPFPGTDLSSRRRRHLSATGSRALVQDGVRALDIIGIGLAGLSTSWWRFDSEPAPNAIGAALLTGTLLAANILPLLQIYRIKHLRTLTFQLPRVLLGWTLAIGIMISVLYTLKMTDSVSRLWLATWFLAGSITLLTTRLGIQWVLNRSALRLSLIPRIAVVGFGEQYTSTILKLSGAEPAGTIAAALDLAGPQDSRRPSTVACVQDFGDLEKWVRAGRIDQVVLALPSCYNDYFNHTVQRLSHLPIEVGWVLPTPSPNCEISGVSYIGGIMLANVLKRPLDGRRYVLKTAVDYVTGGLLILLTIPLMVCIAIAIKLTTKGPIFFTQLRYGFSGNAVSVLKFRTMYIESCDASDAPRVVQATKGDPRVTPIGRILRRTSVDELPQLINVIRGEMSLVGPRPHAVAHDEYYATRIDEYLSRHRVKPGITGWAQVNGLRGETDTDGAMRRRIELDLDYIDNWTLLWDIRILLRTLFVLFDATAY
jgi:Undecaprenyl-phosphate glucose phosphotransferase